MEVTGGEPLIQEESVDLMERLLAEGYVVMLETGGSLPIKQVPWPVIKIVDFKAPSSGMVKHNRWSILDDLAPHDEVKFVIGDRADYDWARARIEEHGLVGRYTILFSPVYGKLEPRTMAGWLLQDRLQARLQLQLHKTIWGPGKRGV
ncbi:7-carboxy-7-deazaguanine synthase [subsurface metagenome]